MSAELIFIWGPGVAGRRTFAARFGVNQAYPEGPPVALSWRGRQLEFELGYRGAVYRSRFSEYDAFSLKRAAGAIYVADSQEERHEANVAFLRRFTEELELVGRTPAELPMVFALNKRDLPSASRVPVLVSQLNWPCCDHVETIATTGVGVEATLNRLLSLIDERRTALSPTLSPAVRGRRM